MAAAAVRTEGAQTDRAVLVVKLNIALQISDLGSSDLGSSSGGFSQDLGLAVWSNMSSDRHDGDDMADVDIENGYSRERNDSHVPEDSTSFDVRVRASASHLHSRIAHDTRSGFIQSDS